VDEIAYRRAKARVEARLGFYRHVVIYVAVKFVPDRPESAESATPYLVYWPMLGYSGTAGMFIPIAGIQSAQIG